MIKNRNLQTGLLVLFITLIGLIAFAKLNQEDSKDIKKNQFDKTELNTKDNLDIAVY